MRSFARRFVLVLAAASLVAACGKGGGTAASNGGGNDASGKFAGDAYVLGNPNAKVTVAEYASVTCPHCAKWEEEVWPAFKAKYVDTGKVRYEFHEFLVHPELDAAGYLLARCAGKDKYFPTVQAIFRSQPEMFQTGDIHAVYLRIAKSMGMSEQQFNACITDEAGLKQLAARNDAATKLGVDGTPTFFVNGKKVAEQEAPLSVFDTAIQPLLK